MIKELSKSLPVVLWRHRWPAYQRQFGLPFARGTMQNFDSAGFGPKASKLDNRTYYLKGDYLAWLEERLASSPHGTGELNSGTTKKGE